METKRCCRLNTTLMSPSTCGCCNLRYFLLYLLFFMYNSGVTCQIPKKNVHFQLVYLQEQFVSWILDDINGSLLLSTENLQFVWSRGKVDCKLINLDQYRELEYWCLAHPSKIKLAKEPFVHWFFSFATLRIFLLSKENQLFNFPNMKRRYLS